MTPQKTYRQGDVLLRERQESPSGIQGEVVARDTAGALVLAYGEATGHCHRIVDSQARLLKTADGQRLLIAAAPVCLRHEEHDPVDVPSGVFEVVIQREYVPGPVQYRSVED